VIGEIAMMLPLHAARDSEAGVTPATLFRKLPQPKHFAEGAASLDHLVSPEEAVRIALARQ
jgi:hypothetical protein